MHWRVLVLFYFLILFRILFLLLNNHFNCLRLIYPGKRETYLSVPPLWPKIVKEGLIQLIPPPANGTYLIPARYILLLVIFLLVIFLLVIFLLVIFLLVIFLLVIFLLVIFLLVIFLLVIFLLPRCQSMFPSFLLHNLRLDINCNIPNNCKVPNNSKHNLSSLSIGPRLDQDTPNCSNTYKRMQM
jgi:hypothetical protein